MKKGEIRTGLVEKVDFPNKGILHIDGEKVVVKNVLPGQEIEFMVTKQRKGKCEGRLLRVSQPSDNELPAPECPHAGLCGGCTYQMLPYEEQLKIKEAQVRGLLDGVCETYEFEGIKGSPMISEYRNKMEFSFGDEVKDGPLALGMHRRGSFYDIVTVDECQLVHRDCRLILKATLELFQEFQVDFYRKIRHTGYLRHLLVRRGVKTGEILVDLVTTTQLDRMFRDADGAGSAGSAQRPGSAGSAQGPGSAGSAQGPGSAACPPRPSERELLSMWRERLLALPLEGSCAGILHTRNDSLADVVKNDETEILYGVDFFYEELLGLRFKITPFSFFQTNSLGAEVLYETARRYIGDVKGCNVFDLYSGTGTIAQILAPVANHVTGIEIVPEAVEAAKENAMLNGLSNCSFVSGDVLKMLDEIAERPDLIILDPPRDGIHPKALEKIIDYGVERMVYISCKPTSLVRDLEVLQGRGYAVEKVCCVDLFPFTGNVETIVSLNRIK